MNITDIIYDLRYKRILPFTIRKKTKRSVLILILTLAALIIIDLLLQRQVAIWQSGMKVLSPLSSRAFITDAKPYQIPQLNPNISEREQNKHLISRIWGKDSWTGQNIARCESGFRTLATNHNTNGTVDQGIFQINSVHGMPSMDNAVANISYAYLMYREQGTNPWDSSRNCWNSVLAEK